MAMSLVSDLAVLACPLERMMRAAMPSAAGFARLLALGVPAATIGPMLENFDLGTARVSISRDGSRWEPEGPDARLLVGVREQGVLVDIAALATHDPDQWAMRRGEGWCLGYDAWLRCETGHAHELRLHATPLAWLKAGGAGLCVLDWDIGLRMLRGLGEAVLLRCDRGAGERLKALLQHGGLPRVKETSGSPLRRAA